MIEIPKRYNPNEYEEKWADFWVKEKTFASKPDEKTPYSIVIPPPNVTGVLHMGHALNNVLQDIIIRVHKIMQKNTMWMPGTDHGGIATQNVVERILVKEGKTRHDLGREKFLDRMWNWKEESGGIIINQLKRIGCGCDWGRLRFTMDEQCSRAVKEAFVRLFNKGLIYRSYRMINWCIRCQTALSDIEVEYEEKDSSLWYIRYPVIGSDDYVVVATTRPETMLGDAAVAVNPKDDRYRHLVGKKVILPLSGRTIPVIADSFVDMTFGTGCVKVTPAHDPNDEEIGKRHNLDEEIGKYVIIDRNGEMTYGVNHGSAKKYFGLDRIECRRQVVKDLEKEGLIEKIEDYNHSVGTCYRCSTVIEPLQQLQWFLKMKRMAAAAAEVTKNGKVQFVPENWQKPYLKWLGNIRDWCLSRQIWWGHRMPIWYCGECNGDDIAVTFGESFTGEYESGIFSNHSYTALRKHLSHEDVVSNADFIFIDEKAVPIVSFTEPEKCPNCGSGELIQDPDVLDTWFSSALWPFSTLGWPEKSKDLEYYYPTDVLVTGHEILYLWVARMVMMGIEMVKDIPFKNVNIHGIIRDEHGKKMSKSKGNVVDPIGIIKIYGTDSLRFALAKSAVPGRDIQLADDDFVGARNFCNKLWNASRLILTNIKIKNIEKPSLKKLELVDKWIIYEINQIAEEVSGGYLEFNNAHTVRKLYDFTWKYFCDWYLELAKIRLYSDDNSSELVENVLVYVLMKILNLLHPIMPFITSQLWEFLKNEVELPYDNILDYNGFETGEYKINVKEVEKMNRIMDIISAIRNIRGENNIQPSTKLEARIRVAGKDKKLIDDYTTYIKVLARLDDVKIDDKFEKNSDDAIAAVGEISIFVPMPRELKKQEEIRLEKKIKETREQFDISNKKIRNRDFIEKASAVVVEAAKKKTEDLGIELERLEKNYDEMRKSDN